MIVVLGEAKITGALVAELGQRGAHVVHAPSAARHSIAAAMAQATVVVLTDNDDSTNVDLALELRRELPTVRLVGPLIDHALGRFLSSTMNKLTVLSLSELASPLLVRAVLAAQMPDGTRQASLSRLAALTPLAAVRNRNTGQTLFRAGVWLVHTGGAVCFVLHVRVENSISRRPVLCLDHHHDGGLRRYFIARG